MCCELQVTPAFFFFFKASRAGVVVGGGKLTAWFPHIAGEEDYASNPPNSICSNEYVCAIKKGTRMCVLLNVRFQLVLENAFSPSHSHINQRGDVPFSFFDTVS